jgi:hypothetical protein
LTYVNIPAKKHGASSAHTIAKQFPNLPNVCRQTPNLMRKAQKIQNGMSSIALGVWVAFLKQPALPGKSSQTKKNQNNQNN